MRFLILLASIGALVLAKPEKYREKEDFEYSRSSSDDGSKSGFYGAQRGNMGGNFEHAHNMDSLAQHQMSSLVRQVDGELGSGANQRTGSVFTSGNSRGVYGSGMYDLSNLKGRNFEESHAYGGSHSSLSSNFGAASNLGYGHEHASSNSRYSSSQSQSAMENSRYHHHSSAESASDLVMGGHQAESLHSGLTQSEYDQQAANNYKYYSGSNGYNSNSRYVSSVPTKVYIRPGQTVKIPISSQTYDASQFNAHVHDQSSLNSDAEVISSDRVVNTLPITKHYESSYKYKKEWEKHDTHTFATPTENPFTQNIENLDNLQVSQGLHHHDNFDANSHSSSQFNKFNSAHSNAYSTGSKLSSSHQSGYHSGLAVESQNMDSSLAGSHAKDYIHEGVGAGNLVEGVNSRPKHYQSSYSYHKSWERQGDPYVIVPDSSSGGSEGQSSQKYTSASENYGHSTSHHGSQYSQSQKGYSSGCNIDCVNGHIRIARSYKTDAENLEQQSQTGWANVEDLGQQTQENWDHLGQQTQNNWENMGQQTQENWDHLGELTQQQQTKWENQEDLGQKSQNVWDKVEVLDQQKENQIEAQKPQNVWGGLEDLEEKSKINLENPKTPNTQEIIERNRPRYITWHEYQHLGQQNQNSGNYAHHVHHGHHQQNNGADDQTYKYHNLHDIYNQEFENWKLMQSISQHLENKHRENNFNTYGINIHPHQEGHSFGHRHDSHCHHTQDASVSNTNYYNSWNTDAQENVHYKHFSDFWNKQYVNGDIFAMPQEPQTVSKQTISENSQQDVSIHNFWNKLDKIDNTLQTPKIYENSHNVDKTVNSTDKTEYDSNVNIVEDKENLHVVHPVDVGRGDIGAEDLISESTSTEQYEKNGVTTASLIQNNNIGHHNLHQNKHKINVDASSTTEDALDLSVVPIKNKPTDKPSSKPSNVQQTDNKKDKADQQLEDWLTQQTSGQQSKDFGQHSSDQQLEHSKNPNTDQELEDFIQTNLEQQLEDFGQKQQNNNQHLEDFKSNTDQQLEDFIQPNTDQQLEDFGQQQNNNQQLEDFKPNTDQQLDDFGQQQFNIQNLEKLKQPSTGKKIEDFKQSHANSQVEDWINQLNIAQQSKDFGQHNSDQQLEDFGQHNLDQQLENFEQQQNNNQKLEDFMKPSTDQQLDDFGQKQNNNQNLEKIKQPSTNKKIEDFEQSPADSQIEDWINQLKMAQQSKDFGQHNSDQQLEDFGQHNSDQQLENFGQHNSDQQLEDFGQHNLDQQLEDFGQHNLDQQLDDFGQHNSDQQSEDFGQHNLDQQLENFGQHNLDQQIEDFKKPKPDQQLEDFGQQVQDQQLETFGQFNVQSQTPQFEDFKHTQDDKLHNNEQKQKYGSNEPQPHLQGLEEPKGRSLELAIPEPVATTTEKTGFWKSVGNKFTGAKNTVAGWFKRS